MGICRTIHNKENPYVQVNKTIVTDNRLSWKAKGLWLYAFSRPDDWKFFESDLVKQSTDGRDSVANGLKELEKVGYLHRHQLRENGLFKGKEWWFFETPKTREEIEEITREQEEADCGKTDNGKSVHGKPEDGKPAPTNKRDTLNKEETKKRERGAAPRARSKSVEPQKNEDERYQRDQIKQEKRVRAPLVFTTDIEHARLAQSPFDAQKRDRAYKRLSEWKEDTPRSKWKKSDYRSILRWVYKAIDEDDRTQKRGRSNSNTDLSESARNQYDGRF